MTVSISRHLTACTNKPLNEVDVTQLTNKYNSCNTQWNMSGVLTHPSGYETWCRANASVESFSNVNTADLNDRLG